MRVDITVETEIANSTRVRQVSAMFDVPPQEKSRLAWQGEIPIESMDWNVGLIVGPSGCGKTTVARNLFADHFDVQQTWGAPSVIDDFSKSLSLDQIAGICQAVGFNTIPAWMRPYAVLSNGEKFRVELARRLLELPDPVVVDEFTSVVDRQVAQIGAHAVQKYVRRNKRKFVAVSCHYDIVEWLQPDWMFEPSTMAFTPRRGLQRRPPLDVTISRVPYSTWKLFAPFHYLTGELHKAARCFGLFVGQRIACFAGIMPKPISNGTDKGTAIAGVSRVVTLPDWQGLGLAFVLLESLGAAYAAVGKRFRNYPAHPAFVRAHDRSKMWAMTKRAGAFSPASGQSSCSRTGWGGRPCAVFEYCGPALDLKQAQRLLAV
jgi:ABC-type polar amino acid transport system ATPase subunit/GNAT superfamily N-acetyltransferase